MLFQVTMSAPVGRKSFVIHSLQEPSNSSQSRLHLFTVRHCSLPAMSKFDESVFRKRQYFSLLKPLTAEFDSTPTHWWQFMIPSSRPIPYLCRRALTGSIKEAVITNLAVDRQGTYHVKNSGFLFCRCQCATTNLQKLHYRIVQVFRRTFKWWYRLRDFLVVENTSIQILHLKRATAYENFKFRSMELENDVICTYLVN
jgi:hypothetical protein